jgi:hypothetical protein
MCLLLMLDLLKLLRKLLFLHHALVKDRLGDQRGGVNGSRYKFFSKERTRPKPQIHNQGFPHGFAKVA